MVVENSQKGFGLQCSRPEGCRSDTCVVERIEHGVGNGPGPLTLLLVPVVGMLFQLCPFPPLYPFLDDEGVPLNMLHQLRFGISGVDYKILKDSWTSQ